MKCFMCKGTMESKNTNYMVDLDDCIIIVKNVPSQVCSQCGEVFYEQPVVEKLESIVNKLKGIITEIAVINYDDEVA